jgi:hypothetical protein
MPVEVAIEKWPHVASILISAAGGEGPPKDYPVKADLVKYVVPWVMTEPTNKGQTPTSREDVRVTDFQYTRPTEGYYFKDPLLDRFEWLPKRPMRSKMAFSDYTRRLREQYGALPKNVEEVTKDTHWRLFLLNRSYLLSGPEEMPIDGFSLNCITGDWDAKRKILYGMIRMFIDPQLLVDKLASSAVEIIGAQPKGGWMYEVGALSETQAAEWKSDGSKPGALLQAKRNAIAEKRIQPLPKPEVPQGTSALMEFGLTSMQTISGITESILSPGEGTGVGLRQRLSVGLLLLAAYFDTSLRFERQQGRITQQFMKLIADDRWIRIGGPFDGQAVQLAKEDFEDEYDTTVDDTEQDPTLRRLWMENVAAILPTLVRRNVMIPELLDFFLLPVQTREKIKQAIQRMGQMQMQMQMQGMAMGGRGKPRSIEEIQAETQRTKGQAALAFAKAQHLGAQAQNIGGERMSSDIRALYEALLDSHRAQLDRERLGLDRQKMLLEDRRQRQSPTGGL